MFSGQESELCHMIIDCCAQQRTYEKYFGLIGQRLCQVTYRHRLLFMHLFIKQVFFLSRPFLLFWCALLCDLMCVVRVERVGWVGFFASQGQLL